MAAATTEVRVRVVSARGIRFELALSEFLNREMLSEEEHQSLLAGDRVTLDDGATIEVLR